MEKLIQKAKDGDPIAFSELIQSQMKEMYRVAGAILMNDDDAADAIQETILACWEKIGTLRQNKHFKTWLTRILIHKCDELIRRNHGVIYTEKMPEIATQSETDLVEWKEMLQALDEKYRLIMVLFYSYGFSAKEIGKMLGMPSSTVRTRLERGRKQLVEYYRGEDSVS